MTTESIKRLIQCEREAKEMINKARKERESARSKARVDAKEVVDSLKKELSEELEVISKENKESLKIIEEQLAKKSDERIAGLKDVLTGKEELVKILVDKVCEPTSQPNK
jgi:F0F1-type ATP synthase membrane subunit b/b'